MSFEEFQTNKRKERRILCLGVSNPKCATCTENNPLCLELHHTSGVTFGKKTVILCRNCHRKISDRQTDHPKPAPQNALRAEQIARYLLGAGELLLMFGETICKYSTELVEILKLFDQRSSANDKS